MALFFAAVTVLLAFSQVANASSYAPTSTSCPSSSLVRPADSLNSNEASYVSQRKQNADKALAAWLAKTNSGFVVNGSLPTLALATSGGGYRSLLVGAGVIQGFDERDSNSSTSGLYQALTYQSGLSGGAWLLSSIAGNNYPTITSLKQNLWEQAFQDSLLVPGNLLVAAAYASITSDIESKAAAGFSPTLTDPWGRLLSYQLFYGTDGGVDITLSSVSSLSNFTNYEAPFPIMLALGVKTWEGDCTPGPNATIYEFTPYEFGSWDSDVSAFTQTEYLGTSLSGGQPSESSCITNYDNIGYILGTSSNLFNEVCIPVAVSNSTADNYTALAQDLSVIVSNTHAIATRDEYAVYPNPFYEYNSSSAVPNSADPVWAQQELRLADGGEANQNDPIWPFLQPYRDVDVLIVNDNSADTSANYPNGSEILTTYVQSTNRNLTKMPYIPSVDTFMAEGLNTRPTFFGCTESDKLTIIYIPNVNMTYDSGQSTYKLEYTTDETDGMVSNGVAMAEQPDDDNWATCLGCAILAKASSTLPLDCTACFAQYCYADLNSTLTSVSSAIPSVSL
ncbi:Lysophospholipase 1 [Paecilomyces lecythidis]|uniref:Lysophospholipase n=1 Tax=Paecilomyces lecythidis TaxID=3004212 RepID=A0ABR3XCP7_9EURO